MGKHEGNCHICGKHTNLTYEHVPPKAALNNMPTKIYSGKDILLGKQNKDNSDTEGLKYKNQQKGAGRYTLCSECNNNTGSYYANHYNNFINALYQLLETEYSEYKNEKSKVGDLYPELHIKTKDINLLAVFKQIISMFCSTTSFGAYGDEFREFLLNKESTAFNRERWMVCIYINTGNRCGSTGLATYFLEEPESLRVAEIITLPLGIILYDLKSPCNIEPYLFGCGITDISAIPYDSKQHGVLELPFYNGARFMPGLSDPNI